MKTLLTVLVFLMGIFSLVFGQNPENGDIGNGGPISIGATGNGGNPMLELCDEPCGIQTRRYVTITIANTYSHPIQIFTPQFTSGRYTSVSSYQNGQSVPLIHLHMAQVVPIPGAWISGLPSMSYNNTYCNTTLPIVVSHPLPPSTGYIQNGLGGCFPYMIPANSTVNFLAEFHLTFDCLTDSLGNILYHVIPRGTFNIDAFIVYNDPQVTMKIFPEEPHNSVGIGNEQHTIPIDLGCVPIDFPPYNSGRTSSDFLHTRLNLVNNNAESNLILTLSSERSQNYHYKIINCSGKEVSELSKEIVLGGEQKMARINTSFLGSGLYFINIYGKGSKKTFKFIKR